MSKDKAWPFAVAFLLLSPVMIVVLLVILVMGLSGCAHTETKPEVTRGLVTVEPVKIPVLVPCLTREQVPTPPSTWMRTDKSGDFNETAAAIDIKQAREYMVTSQSLMWGCVKSFEEEKTK